MEFQVNLSGSRRDADRLAALVQSEDPAAVAILDPVTKFWRVITNLRSDELMELLARGGYPLERSRATATRL